MCALAKYEQHDENNRLALHAPCTEMQYVVDVARSREAQIPRRRTHVRSLPSPIVGVRDIPHYHRRRARTTAGSWRHEDDSCFIQQFAIRRECGPSSF